MSSHYLDIEVLRDPEFPAHQLLSALYAKLHRALVQFSVNSIAVSFPDYSAAPPSLGSRMRLIGPELDLARLLESAWLNGMRDHIELGGIAAVPADAALRTLRRVQAKSSPERLRRRQMRRHGLTEAEALQRAPDTAAEKLRLPFVQLASGSTGQTFRLYLRMGTPAANSLTCEFNAFGLSGAASIPWF